MLRRLKRSNLFFFTEWEEFKRIFNKTFANQIEEEKRQKIFLQNKSSVDAHNLLFERGIETYSLAINEFSDRTYDEVIEVVDSSDSVSNNKNELVTHSLNGKHTEANMKANKYATEYVSRQQRSRAIAPWFM